MVLSLTAITLVVGGLLGAVAFITNEPIAKAAADKQQAAISAVVPVEGATPGEPKNVTSENKMPAIIFPVTKDGKLVGNAVQATSKNGFGGNVTVMFGFDVEGNILGYSVLDCSNETPGLGAKMPDWFQATGKGNVIGKNPSKNNLIVSKDQSKDGKTGEVDAITAATISSRAFLDALAQAYGVLTGADVASSASQQVEAEAPACGGCEKACEQACDSCQQQCDSCKTECADCPKKAAGKCCKENK